MTVTFAYKNKWKICTQIYEPVGVIMLMYVGFGHYHSMTRKKTAEIRFGDVHNPIFVQKKNQQNEVIFVLIVSINWMLKRFYYVQQKYAKRAKERKMKNVALNVAMKDFLCKQSSTLYGYVRNTLFISFTLRLNTIFVRFKERNL